MQLEHPECPLVDELAEVVERTSLVALGKLGADGRILYANPGAGHVLGIPTAEIVRRVYNSPEWGVEDWNGAPIPDDELPFRRAIATRGEIVNARHAIRFPSGERKLLSINVVPIEDAVGAPTGVWFSLFDVTAEATANDRVNDSAVQLRHTENHLATARELAEIGSWTINFGGDPEVEWCPRMAAIHGISLDEFGGTVASSLALIHPHDRERVAREKEEIVATRTPRPVTFRIVRPDGEVRHVWGEGKFEFDGQGEPVRFSGFVQDVTARVEREAELEESRERLELALDGTSLGLWDWNVQTGDVFFNDRWAEMLGYDPGEIVPHVRSWERLVHPEDMPAVQATLQHHLDGETPVYETEHRMRTKSGEWRWIRDRGRVVRRDESGRAMRMTGTHEDVDERKQHELDLADARSVAESASAAKSAFLANMSHEIRTPLAAMLGYCDVLDDEAFSTGERRSAIATIRRNGEHLLEIINDILDLSKIEAGHAELDLRPCRPHEIVEEILCEARVRENDQSVKLSTVCHGSVPTNIRIDDTRFRQILNNLVGNAVKFTDEGEVRVCLASEESPPRLVVEVIDTGIGMDEEQVDRVFAPFQQADASSTRRHGGTGLGLTIARRLVEVMGGQMTVESRVGIGSTFRFRIPFEPAERSSTLSVPETGRGDRVDVDPPLRSRVLVVDDADDLRRLIRMYLERAGFEVVECVGGAEGVEAAMEAERTGKPFDVVLLDMQMPCMDGYTAARRLRATGFDRTVIALTAHAMRGDRERCLAAGCDEYVAKPVNRKTIVELVSMHAADPGMARATDSSRLVEDRELAVLFETFQRALPERMAAIRRAADSGVMEEVAHLAHQLKGSAGGYGYPDLSTAAARLESAANAGNSIELTNSLHALAVLVDSDARTTR